MAREADEYQVASLVGGFPLCTFRPRPYPRKVTNVVVTNGASGEVRCYRGTTNSIAVARNSKGDSNTLMGNIALPAGQLFFVQWENSGTPVTSATARVSFERVDGNFEGGDSAAWSEESVGRIVVPSDGETDPSNPPYIIIANDTSQSGIEFASLIFRTPTLPADWEYRLQIRKSSSPPSAAQFELVLWDTSIDDQVSRLVTQTYNSSDGSITTVVGPRFDDPDMDIQYTDIWGGSQVQISTQHPTAGSGSMFIDTNDLSLRGQVLPSVSNLDTVFIGLGNTTPVAVTIQGNLDLIDTFGAGGIFTASGGALITPGPTTVADLEITGLLSTTPWAKPTLVNGWTNRGGIYPDFQYRTIASNQLQIVGEIVPGTLVNGTVITTLPAGFRPVDPVLIPARKGASAVAYLQLDSTGQVQIFDGAGSTLVQISPTLIPLDTTT